MQLVFEEVNGISVFYLDASAIDIAGALSPLTLWELNNVKFCIIFRRSNFFLDKTKTVKSPAPNHPNQTRNNPIDCSIIGRLRLNFFFRTSTIFRTFLSLFTPLSPLPLSPPAPTSLNPFPPLSSPLFGKLGRGFSTIPQTGIDVT